MSYYASPSLLDFFEAVEREVQRAQQQHQKPAAPATSAPLRPSGYLTPSQRPISHVTPHIAPASSTSESVFVPPVDVYDTDSAYKILVSVPGAVKSKIEVHFTIHNHELAIDGEIAPSSSGSSVTALVSERHTGKFGRKLHLPSEVKIDDEKISAKYVSGVLEITVPKVATGSAPRRKIQVEDVEDEELLAESQGN